MGISRLFHIFTRLTLIFYILIINSSPLSELYYSINTIIYFKSKIRFKIMVYFKKFKYLVIIESLSLYLDCFLFKILNLQLIQGENLRFNLLMF